MRRIAIMHGSNDLYGASRVLVQDVRALRILGWHVSVVLPEAGPLSALLVAEGAAVSLWPLRVLRKVSLARSLRLPVRVPPAVADADVVVVWTVALAGYLPTLVLRRKVVVTSVHEILGGRLGSLLARFTVLLSHVVVVNSKTTGAWLRTEGGRRSPVVLAYPEAPRYEPLPMPDRSPRSFTAVLAGRVNGHKGHLEAVRAGRLVRSRGLDFRLTLVGGSYPGQERHRDALEREVQGEEWATYIGEVSDVRPVLADAQLVLVPTTQPEPFGVVALEAWAAGRRVVASNAGGLAEAAAMVDGLTVPPSDVRGLAEGIWRVANDPALSAPPRPDAEASVVCTPEARAAAWHSVFTSVRAERLRAKIEGMPGHEA